MATSRRRGDEVSVHPWPYLQEFTSFVDNFFGVPDLVPAMQSD